MLTKADCLNARYGQTFRYLGGTYSRSKELKQVRVSGKCQTWKTRPDDFKLPVKYGMYESLYITPENAAMFITEDEYERRKDQAQAVSSVLDAPAVRRNPLPGMRITILQMNNGTWLESEEAAYPEGGKTRKGKARVENAIGELVSVRAGIADSYFTIPANAIMGKKTVRGFLTSDDGTLIFNQSKNSVQRVRRNPSPGLRIVHNKLLGGWFIVRGPHQTPIGGRFASKAEAEAHLRQDRTEGIRYSLPRVRRNPSRNPTLRLKRKRVAPSLSRIMNRGNYRATSFNGVVRTAAQQRAGVPWWQGDKSIIAVFKVKTLAVNYGKAYANHSRKSVAIEKRGAEWIVREVRK